VGRPVEAVAGQRGVVLVDDGGEADVAGVGDEQRGERLVQAGGPGVRAADVGVLVEEAGPTMHFEGYVGDLDLGEQRLDHGPQADQRRRLLHGVEGADHDPVGAVAVLDAEIRIGVEPVRRSAPGLVEDLAQLATTLAGSVSRARASHAWSRWVSQVASGSSSARGSPQRMLPGAYRSRRRSPTRRRSRTQQA